MFDTSWIDELDGDAACAAVVEAHAGVLEHEARILCLAAHWANLHSGDALDSEGRVLPGMERSRQLGGPGTPRVQEFCTAEFGALQGVGCIAADNLQRDALDLQYRHPLLWAATVSTGTVRVWQAREVAKLAHVAGLSLEQAHWLDDQTTCRMGALPWGRFLALVEAKIIEADPTAAEARRVAAAMERFVRTGRSNEYGLKTIIAKAEAGDAIFFLAMCDRLTQILALRGDTDPVEVRRSKALGILANPIRAAALLQHYAQVQDDDPDTGNRAGPGDDEDAADDAGADDENDPDEVGEGDLHPAHNDADDPVCTGDPTAFVKPMTVDPRKLLPPATLYVHLSETSFTRAAAGVARFEGVGPITIDQACDFLQHCNVVVKPVIDVANQAPVDGYEAPAAMAEALHLRNPSCVSPYGTNLSRRKDRDHTIPYRAPAKGGPPGQTGLGNLGPLSRFPHRLKTHGRWRLRQPEPGVYLWRSPHGWIFLVNHTGTHPLGNTTTAHAVWDIARVDAAGDAAGSTVDVIPATDTLQYQPHHVA